MSEHPTVHRHDAPRQGCCGCGGNASPAGILGTLAKDPVCGMAVDPVTSKHRFDHEGATYHFCCGGCRSKFIADPAKHLSQPAPEPAHPQPVTDPVCGMRVDAVTAKHRIERDGEAFHFCSARCRAKFAADPESYLNSQGRASGAAELGATYTCPMHPQIRRAGPGSCPICGMALEPLEITAEGAPNHELADMTRRFWVGLALTLPVFVLEMGSHLPGMELHDLVAPATSIWVQFALSTPVVAWAGWPFFQRGWASVRSGHLNMFTLIALGTGAAYLYSLVATFAPGLFPDGFRMMGRGNA